MRTLIRSIKRYQGSSVRTFAAGADGLPSITITTPSVDRQGDRLLRLRVAGKLPVLFAHDARELPVGEAVRTQHSPQGIRAWWRWLENDARAARVRNAFEQDMLSASVGVDPDANPVRNAYGGYDLGGEVVEFSLVPVPTNPECVRLLRGLGWDTSTSRPATLEDIERALRGQAVAWELEEARRRNPHAIQAVVRQATRDAVGATGPEIDRVLNRLRGRIE